jgi:hypothetical protein
MHPEITDYLINTDEPEILRHFTERRLRPLTLLASDDDKIIKFMEIESGIRDWEHLVEGGSVRSAEIQTNWLTIHK